MKLRDLRKQLRGPDRRCKALDMSALISGEIVRFSDGTPAVFAGSFREGSHVIVGVDPGSGESASYEQTVDGNGRVIRVRKLEPGTSEKTRQNLLDKAFSISPRVTPGPARLIATDLDEKAGTIGGAPGGDCSAIQVCPRADSKEVFKIHRGCVITSLGRSLGTLFSRYYRPEAEPSPVLKATFWETHDWAVHIMDPHASARLVRLIENPSPPEYETIKDVRRLLLRCSPVEGREERLSIFNLYPAEVDACGCQSPWDGARADCVTCRGLGWVWRLRLHPMLLPERGAVEAAERTAARLKL